MPKRIIPLILVLAVAGSFGHRAWVKRQAALQERSFYGTVEAVEVTLSAQVGGKIVELPADEGKKIESGGLVAAIEDTLYRAQADQAAAALRTAEAQLKVLQANLAGIETNLNRVRKLLASGSATQMQLDDLETQKSILEAQKAVVASQRQQAEAALRLAEEQLGYTRIFSPVAGTVLRVPVELGETVFPGTALATLADLGTMEVKVYVPAPMLDRIRPGQRVDLRTDGSGERVFSGEVATIADEAEFTPKNVQTREERVRLVYAVKVRVPNPEGVLKIGMPVDCWFVEP